MGAGAGRERGLPVVAAGYRTRQTATGHPVAQGWPDPLARPARHHRHPAVGGAHRLHRSGLTWSRYWGRELARGGLHLTLGTEIDAPSTAATVGDFDRLGRRIAWADKEDPVYASAASGTRPLSFGDIDRIARSRRT